MYVISDMRAISLYNYNIINCNIICLRINFIWFNNLRNRLLSFPKPSKIEALIFIKNVRDFSKYSILYILYGYSIYRIYSIGIGRLCSSLIKNYILSKTSFYFMSLVILTYYSRCSVQAYRKLEGRVFFLSGYSTDNDNLWYKIT